MLIPKKSLGQNYLLDRNIAKKIIDSINILNQTIIEIGPGTGKITDEIIKFIRTPGEGTRYFNPLKSIG